MLKPKYNIQESEEIWWQEGSTSITRRGSKDNLSERGERDDRGTSERRKRQAGRRCLTSLKKWGNNGWSRRQGNDKWKRRGTSWSTSVHGSVVWKASRGLCDLSQFDRVVLPRPFVWDLWYQGHLRKTRFVAEDTLGRLWHLQALNLMTTTLC